MRCIAIQGATRGRIRCARCSEGELFKTLCPDSTLFALLKSEARSLEVIWEGLTDFHSGVPVETVSG